MSERHLVRAIGGSPRVGKDTSTNLFHELYPEVQIISADDDIRKPLLQNAYWRSWARKSIEAGMVTYSQALFQETFDGRRWADDEEWFENVTNRMLPDGKSYFVKRHEDQHEAVWELGNVREVVERASETGPVLIQGASMRPRFFRELANSGEGFEVRAIYLGNENENFTETMVGVVHEAAATDPKSNWMADRQWSDARIRRYTEFVRIYSVNRRKEAADYGFPYIDMGKFEDFHGDAVPRVVGYLATGDVKILTQ